MAPKMSATIKAKTASDAAAFAKLAANTFISKSGNAQSFQNI
jgi:hypothetical protein